MSCYMTKERKKKKKDRLTYLSLATFPWNKMRLVSLSRRHSFSYIKFIAILIILRTSEKQATGPVSQKFRNRNSTLKSSETGWISTKWSDNFSSRILFSMSQRTLAVSPIQGK